MPNFVPWSGGAKLDASDITRGDSIKTFGPSSFPAQNHLNSSGQTRGKIDIKRNLNVTTHIAIGDHQGRTHVVIANGDGSFITSDNRIEAFRLRRLCEGQYWGPTG